MCIRDRDYGVNTALMEAYTAMMAEEEEDGEDEEYLAEPPEMEDGDEAVQEDADFFSEEGSADGELQEQEEDSLETDLSLQEEPEIEFTESDEE